MQNYAHILLSKSVYKNDNITFIYIIDLLLPTFHLLYTPAPSVSAPPNFQNLLYSGYHAVASQYQ